MRIAFLTVRHPPERKSPIMPELYRLLRERGAEVEVLHPDEELTDLARLRVEHDLYVLKSGAETALSLAGALHAQGAAILNPYPVAAALRDKVVATRALQAAGVPVPETFVASDPARLAPLLAGGPLIVKPYRGSQGRGVRVVRSADELAGGAADDPVAFCQRHHPPDGPDRKLYWIGGRVFGVERTWPPRSYEDKVGQPFAVSPALRDLARRCGAAFGVDLFGVDVIESGGHPYVVDMQAFPGFKGVPDAALHLAEAVWGAAERARRGERSSPAGALALDREREVAARLAREAGAVLRRRRTGPLEVRRKAGGERVTQADLEANELIRAGLQAAFPGDAIFSEEEPDAPARLAARRVWIVDPLDSTSDYLDGGDEHSVSIGLAVQGRPVLGAVYNPARDELVAGYQGGGVTLNGAPAEVTGRAALEGAGLLVSRKEWRRGLAARAGGLPLQPMASMAYKLARVAAGLADGALSVAPRKEWGTCAGVALVLAAGGLATLLDGASIGFNRAERRQPLGMAAAGPRLHAALLAAARPLQPAAESTGDERIRPCDAPLPSSC